MSKKRFRKVYIEITNICNLNCSFCPMTNRAKAFMSVEEFEKIAIQVSKYSNYVYLHVKGEPLIHPHLDSILKICSKYDLKVNISTNGILLLEKLGVLMNNNVRQINISLHSFKENNMLLSGYMKNVILSSNKLANKGCNIRYKLWNMQGDNENNENVDIIEILEKEYNLKIENIKCGVDTLLANNIYLSFESLFEWPDINKTNINDNGTCHGLKEQLAILVNGDVVPCCLDHEANILLGNILKKDLEDILKSNKVEKIIEGFKNNKCIEKLCKKCNYKYRLKSNLKKSN